MNKPKYNIGDTVRIVIDDLSIVIKDIKPALGGHGFEYYFVSPYDKKTYCVFECDICEIFPKYKANDYVQLKNGEIVKIVKIEQYASRYTHTLTLYFYEDNEVLLYVFPEYIIGKYGYHQ